ncbi:MAG: hypothetical protein LCI00_23430 [Chloroflexi bacterium]|nr:hypothetical protein [Chloroflexota bacterium]MCC6896007.1 PD40 domain-containing protein [Anaerolineae bacterium]
MIGFLLRVLTLLAVGCTALVAAGLSVGRMLPPEDDIVFSNNVDERNFEIYRMSPKRNIKINLTNSRDEDTHPVWSPNGQEIAFIKENLSSYTIYLMDANGGNLRPISDQPHRDSDPMWSPDGRFIAFTSGETEEVMLAELQTGIIRRLTNDDVIDLSPAWLLDSQHLTFISGADFLTETDLMVLDIQTGILHPYFPAKELMYVPSWSPDNRYLLRVMYALPEAFYGIFLWDTSSEKSIALYSSIYFDRDSPKWSPDGQFIIFTESIIPGQTHIFRLDVDSCIRNLDLCTPKLFMSGKGFYSTPSWRPASP